MKFSFEELYESKSAGDILLDGLLLYLRTTRGHDVDGCCALLDVDQRLLYSYVKHFTGLTPKQFINRWRIRQAAQMLADQPQLGYEGVAKRCGFCNARTLMRALRASKCELLITNYKLRAPRGRELSTRRS